MGRGEGQQNASQSTDLLSRQHEQLFKQGLDYLNDEYPFFLTHVLNIGRPAWNNSIVTAAVALEDNNRKKNDFQFLFNPQFAASLSAAEMGFVTAHETMHILFNHLQLGQSFDNQELFNLAADAVINDYLSDQGLELPEGVVTGLDLINEDCAGLTVSEVYERARQEAQPASEEDYRQMDEHDWIHNPQQGAPEAAEQAYQQAKEQLPSEVKDIHDDSPQAGAYGTQAGYGDDNALRNWREDHGLSLAWEELLKEIDPDIFADPSKGPPPRTSFARRPRRLAGFPQTILPDIHKPEKDKKRAQEKPTIVMALDTSGSIGHNTANNFITLAKSIPEDKVNLFACTFTTSYRELDLDNPQFSMGGTDFSPIENFIKQRVIGKKPPGSKKELKKYPRAVIVITDGMATFRSSRPDQQQLEDNWLWLIEGRGSNGQKGRSFSLNKFIR